MFTCRMTRSDYVAENDMVDIDIYEWHDHPRNLWERVREPWKYSLYKSAHWVPYGADSSLKERVIDLCKDIVRQNDDRFRADEEWKSI